MTTRALVLTGALCLAACGSPSEEPEAAEPECESPAVADLGVPFRGAGFARFTTSGGAIYVGVKELATGTVLGDVTLTRVEIGLADRLPATGRPTDQASSGPATTADVRLDKLTKVTLDAGSYWLWSSNGGRITLHTCEPITVDDVRVAHTDPGSGFGVDSSTQSPGSGESP